jgi:hypothetical protein
MSKLMILHRSDVVGVTQTETGWRVALGCERQLDTGCLVLTDGEVSLLLDDACLECDRCDYRVEDFDG